MADSNEKDTVKAEKNGNQSTDQEQPAKCKVKEAAAALDTEKMKAFMLKNITLYVPVWALILIIILALVAIID